MSLENIYADLYHLDSLLYIKFKDAVSTADFGKIKDIQREIIDTKSRIEYPDSPKIIRELDNFLFDHMLERY